MFLSITITFFFDIKLDSSLRKGGEGDFDCISLVQHELGKGKGNREQSTVEQRHHASARSFGKRTTRLQKGWKEESAAVRVRALR